MSDTLRCFVGVSTTPEVDQLLQQRLKSLRPALGQADVRWLNEANYHMTLQFLGATRVEVVSELEHQLAAVAGQSSCFSVTLRQIAPFPDAKSVVVAALGETNPALNALLHTTATRLTGLGFKPDARRYQPHITLGRIKRRPVQFAPLKLEVELPVARIALYQSTSSPQGAQYRVLSDYPLHS